MDEHRVEVYIDRALEQLIRERLSEAEDVSLLIEQLLLEWLEAVEEDEESSQEDLLDA